MYMSKFYTLDQRELAIWVKVDIVQSFQGVLLIAFQWEGINARTLI